MPLHAFVALTLAFACQDVKQYFKDQECCGNPHRTIDPTTCVRFDTLETAVADVTGKIEDLQDRPVAATVASPIPSASFVLLSCNDPGTDGGFSGSRTIDHQTKLFDKIESLRPTNVIMMGDNWYADLIDLNTPSSSDATSIAYSQETGDFASEADRILFFDTWKFKASILESIPSFSRMKNGNFVFNYTSCQYTFHAPNMIPAWDDHDFSPNNGGGNFKYKAESKRLFADFWNKGSVTHFSADKNASDMNVEYVGQPTESCPAPDGLQQPQFAMLPENNIRLVHPGEDEGIFQEPYYVDLDLVLGSRYARPPRQLEIIVIDDHYYRTPAEITEERNRSYFGEKQKRWLEKVVAGSTAYMRMFVVSSPIFSPDYLGSDNSYYYPDDLMWLVNLLNKYNLHRSIFVGGDFHSCFVTVDGRFTQFPLVNIVASGAHYGDPYTTYDSQYRAYWGSQHAGSMFLEAKLFMPKSGVLPQIELTHWVREGNEADEYAAVSKVVIPLSMLESSYPQKASLPAMESPYVNECLIIVKTGGARLLTSNTTYGATTFSTTTDSVEVSAVGDDGRIIMDHIPTVSDGVFTGWLRGADIATELRYGENIRITLHWLRGGVEIFSRQFTHEVTFVNGALRNTPIVLGADYPSWSLENSIEYVSSIVIPADQPLAVDMKKIDDTFYAENYPIISKRVESTTPYAATDAVQLIENSGLRYLVSSSTTDDVAVVLGKTLKPDMNTGVFADGLPISWKEYEKIAVTMSISPPFGGGEMTLVVSDSQRPTLGSDNHNVVFLGFEVEPSGRVTMFGYPFDFYIRPPSGSVSFGYPMNLDAFFNPQYNFEGATGFFKPTNAPPYYLTDMTIVWDYEKSVTAVFFNDEYAGSFPQLIGWRGFSNVALLSEPSTMNGVLFNPHLGNVRVSGKRRAVPVQSPVGDTCTDAPALSENTKHTMDLKLADTETYDVDILRTAVPDITTRHMHKSRFVKFTPSQTKTYTIDTCCSDPQSCNADYLPTDLLIFEESCDEASAVAGFGPPTVADGVFADVQGCQQGATRADVELTAGRTYYVGVGIGFQNRLTQESDMRVALEISS